MSSFVKFISSLFIDPPINNNQKTIKDDYDLMKLKINATLETIKTLNSLRESGELAEFKILSDKFIEDLEVIDKLNYYLRDFMDYDVNSLIKKKVSQLKLEYSINSEEEIIEIQIERFAPELKILFNEISEKSDKIEKKINSLTYRKEELKALYETKTQKVLDILFGYIKISKSPEEFNNPDELLLSGKESLEILSEDLSNFLINLNEDSLQNYKTTLNIVAKGEI